MSATEHARSRAELEPALARYQDEPDLLLLDRHLKDSHGSIVGIRTVFAPVEL